MYQICRHGKQDGEPCEECRKIVEPQLSARPSGCVPMGPNESVRLIESACLAIAEMAVNCEHDLVGDHRENYNPRIMTALKSLAQIFPAHMAEAIQKAKLF